MFMAKRTIMKKALGASAEDEYKPGAAELAKVHLLQFPLAKCRTNWLSYPGT